jgi:hypothetical protein
MVHAILCYYQVLLSSCIQTVPTLPLSVMLVHKTEAALTMHSCLAQRNVTTGTLSAFGTTSHRLHTVGPRSFFL